MAKQATQSASRAGERNRERGKQQQGNIRGASREEQGGSDWQGMMSERKHQMDEMVQEHAGQSVLIALVAGFGIGYLIGCALASDGESSSYSRWSRLTDRSAAEGIGRRVMDSLDRILPDAISSRFTS